MTDGQKQYLRLLAVELIDGEDEYPDPDHPTLEELRDGLWSKMSQAERDGVNEFVDVIFGEWL